MKGEKALKKLFVNKKNRIISNIISLFFFAFSFLFIIFVNVLVANTQPSVPIGLYIKAGDKNLKKGDIVVFRLDEKYNKEIKITNKKEIIIRYTIFPSYKNF